MTRRPPIRVFVLAGAAGASLALVAVAVMAASLPSYREAWLGQMLMGNLCL